MTTSVSMRPTQRTRVLLIEDNVNDAELTTRALKASGVMADVDVINDGEEAIHYLQGVGLHEDRLGIMPALVILDLKMAKLDGVETLAEIKSNDRLQSLPVVILTSSAEPQDLRTCYRLGANGYVVKPVDAERFMETIKDLAVYWLKTNQPPPD